MNRNELNILKQIEIGLSKEDAAFAERLASGPRLSVTCKLVLAMTSLIGIGLTMMFPMHLMFGVTGYVVLVGVGTYAVRRRPVKPAHESPLQFFHRLTAGLFANTTTMMEAGLD